MKARAFVTTIAVGLTVWVSSASAVCPSERAAPPDAPFVYERDATHCVLANGKDGVPESRQPVRYRVTCPGRMTPEDAQRVGRALIADRPLQIAVEDLPKTRLSIREMSGFADRGLRPVFVGVSDLSQHKDCRYRNQRVVCTDFKVTVKMQPLGPVEIAKHCTEVNQSGSIALGKRMDREYKCRVHFLSSEASLVPEVTRLLLKRDYLEEARSKKLRVCALRDTSFQCAPCSTTDKLVVRVVSYSKDMPCPAGTIGSVE